MQLSKYVSVSLIVLLSLSARAEFLGTDGLFTGIRQPTKGQSGLPKAYAKNADTFDLTIDDGDAETDSREPASVSPQKVKAPSAHWSASASEGFEYKVRVKQQLSAIWVLKRGEHYDFIFATNGGSRVNLGLPAEQFYALKNAATDLRAPASDMSKCKDAFMELEVVDSSTHKQVAMCLNAKSKAADQLRAFASTLTAYVR